MGLKEGGYVKKIVKAWIQQIIEFDSEEEYNKYADSSLLEAAPYNI